MVPTGGSEVPRVGSDRGHLAIRTSKHLSEKQRRQLNHDEGPRSSGATARALYEAPYLPRRHGRSVTHFDAARRIPEHPSTSGANEELRQAEVARRLRRHEKDATRLRLGFAETNESKIEALTRSRGQSTGKRKSPGYKEENRFYGSRTTRRSSFGDSSFHAQHHVPAQTVQVEKENLTKRHCKSRAKKLVTAAPPIEVIISDGDESEEGEGVDEGFLASSLLETGARRSPRLNAGPSGHLPDHRVTGILKKAKLKCSWRSKYNSGGSIAICAQDMDSLEEGEFLNDTVIDYYINFLLDEMHERTTNGQFTKGVSREDIFVFGTFFYRKLMSSTNAWDKLDNWTRDVDVFSKKYVFIPICVHYHWSLVLICNKPIFDWEDNTVTDVTTSIIHMDSLVAGHATGSITKNLRNFLEHQWHRNLSNPGTVSHKVHTKALSLKEHYEPEKKRFSRFEVLGGKLLCPRQNNYCDCGLFLLKFLEKFIHDPPTSIDVKIVNKKFTVEHTGSSEKFNTREWFKPEDAANLRFDLRIRLCELIYEENKDSAMALKALEAARNAPRPREVFLDIKSAVRAVKGDRAVRTEKSRETFIQTRSGQVNGTPESVEQSLLVVKERRKDSRGGRQRNMNEWHAPEGVQQPVGKTDWDFKDSEETVQRAIAESFRRKQRENRSIEEAEKSGASMQPPVLSKSQDTDMLEDCNPYKKGSSPHSSRCTPQSRNLVWQAGTKSSPEDFLPKSLSAGQKGKGKTTRKERRERKGW